MTFILKLSIEHKTIPISVTVTTIYCHIVTLLTSRDTVFGSLCIMLNTHTDDASRPTPITIPIHGVTKSTAAGLIMSIAVTIAAFPR